MTKMLPVLMFCTVLVLTLADTIPAVSKGECGKVLHKPKSSSGPDALEGQWPWQVAIYKTKGVDSTFICGGTLVSASHVITAAHCVTKHGSNKLNNETLSVHLGKHNLRTSIVGVQIRPVEIIKVHPEYNFATFTHDLAILKLTEEARFTEWVQPACLWPENEVELSNIVRKMGSVAGWGKDKEGPTEELALEQMQVVDQETCIRSLIEFYGRFTSSYTYCAGFKDGTPKCNSVSGAGMTFEKDGIWYLRGLLSLSAVSENEHRCDPKRYIVLTDLAKHLKWIKENIN